MSDILNNLEKIVKAGIGAASEGLEEAARAVEHFAEKGEPAYNEAREKVTDAVNSLKKTFAEAVKTPPEEEQIKSLLRCLPTEVLDRVADFISALKEERRSAAAEAPEEDAGDGENEKTEV